MEYRTLGRTGYKISTIGLGTEYLHGKNAETVSSTIKYAIMNGVNYFDLVFSFEEYLDHLSGLFCDDRASVCLTGHLGSTVKNNQYLADKDPVRSIYYFERFLRKLNLEAVDILFLHCCDSEKDYQYVMSDSGILNTAEELQKEGKAKYIGFSGHTVSTAMKAVKSGMIDVLMFPVHLAANAVTGKRDLLNACIKNNVGLIGMKPFAGGKLLQSDGSVNLETYQIGDTKSFNLERTKKATSTRCISYVLAQPGVSATVPGCGNVYELADCLTYFSASNEDKDFSDLVLDCRQFVLNECVYCNHCLPCPVGIDIGQVNRLYDLYENGSVSKKNIAVLYNQLNINASSCTQCGLCEKRCFFDVKGIDIMKKAANKMEAL